MTTIIVNSPKHRRMSLNSRRKITGSNKKEGFMIIEVSGDILNSKAEAIAHGIAPSDHFNQGLALSLREMWPSMAKDFRHYCKLHSPESGTVWTWIGSDGKKIINMMTQDAPEQEGHNPKPATLKNVNHALKELRSLIQKDKIKTVALPKIATGVGGLEWADVKGLIQTNLGDLDTKVYVYTEYKKGMNALEN